jgi:heme-degrading monooxygenase HmoA
MYAHINIWHLNERGGSSDDTAAREIGAELSKQPGFRSYTLVRTGEREVVAVTLFDSADHLDAATRTLVDFVRARVGPLADGEPERRRGDVLYHTQG